MVGVVDAVFPTLQRFKVQALRFQGVAEHPEGRDRDVTVADGVEATLAKFGEVLAARGLPEERLETFKAEARDFSDPGCGVAAGGVDHRADAKGAGGIGHEGLRGAMGWRWRVSALAMAPNTIARLRMLSAPAVSGAVPAAMASRNRRSTDRWPSVSSGC